MADFSRDEDRELLERRPDLAANASNVEQRLEAWAAIDASVAAGRVDLRRFAGPSWEEFRWCIWRARDELARAATLLRERGI